MAYKKVGLIQQEKKQRRDETSGIILGADFDGLAGRVMPPRSRIALLSLVSMAIVHKGTCTNRLLSMVVGCWIHVLLFRRPLFAIMSSVFNEGKGRSQDEVFCLRRQTLCELQLLASLGCMAQSDTRARHDPKVYCTDASPAGGAVCYAYLGGHASKEFGRHTEQREELGSQAFVSEPIKPSSSCVPTSFNIPPPLAEGFVFDCCEIFRGSGNWSTAHSEVGLQCHDGVDFDGRRLRCSALQADAVVRELISLACRGVVRQWHAGVPCVSYGTFRRPQVSSNEFPYGFNPEDPFTKYHNKLAQRTCFILMIAVFSGSYISVEQPRDSRLFLLHCYRQLLRLGCVISHFSFCSFGSAFHKPSKWQRDKPWLIKPRI